MRNPIPGPAGPVLRGDDGTLRPHTTVGAAGVELTPLGLGGAALGGMYDTVAPEDALASVQRAYELGIRYFDSAPQYAHGLSEQRLGWALAGVDRTSYALSTKVGVMIEPHGPDERRYSNPMILDGHFDFGYDACLASLEASMDRLGTDRFDIVFIHDPDEAESLLPVSRRTGADHLKEAMDGAYRALHELRDQGVVGAVGVGLNGTEMLVRFAQAGDFDCFLLAGRYTLLEQHGVDDLLPRCEERGITIVAGGVFNSGILATGSAAPEPTYNYVGADAATVERVAAIERVCDEHGVPLSAAALQFPLGAASVGAVIAGMRSAREVEENVQRITLPIPPALWQALPRAEAP
jgi:D-threo-aldose 1-dehydrogenase